MSTTTSSRTCGSSRRRPRRAATCRLPGDLGHRQQRQPRGDPVRGAARRAHLPRRSTSRRRTSGIVVSYGFCERFRGTHYNTSALVGPDGLIGLQRKVHASYDEFFRFRQAYEWGVYDLGFCTVGTAICHDSDFFESWRILALKGAEVILLPAREPDDAGRRRRAHLRRARERPAGRRHPARPGGAARGAARARRGCTTSSPATTASTPSSPTWSGSTATAPMSAAPTCSRPTGRCSPGRSSATATRWIGVDLDPAPLERARENPWFALKKRRPEAYDELTTRL